MINNNQLEALVQRIERLEDEKAVLTVDISEVYQEAKGVGFDPKILRKVIAIRKQDQAKVKEEAAVLDLYLQALGMTPLEVAIAKEAEQ